MKHLSKRQKQVATDLMNGYVIVASSQSTGAWIANDNGNQYHISNRVFFNLVDKNVIRQQYSAPFDYILTPEFLELQQNTQ
jgi:hypothetical protein